MDNNILFDLILRAIKNDIFFILELLTASFLLYYLCSRMSEVVTRFLNFSRRRADLNSLLSQRRARFLRPASGYRKSQHVVLKTPTAKLDSINISKIKTCRNSLYQMYQGLPSRIKPTLSSFHSLNKNVVVGGYVAVDKKRA